MASKKGMAVTGVVLAAITGASFLVWLGPAENPATFVISDPQDYLDRVKNIHGVLQESITLEYQGMISGRIATQDYIVITQAVSSQTTSQISEFVKSKPPEQWQASYIHYMEAMKKFNQYVGETQVLASLIEADGTGAKIDAAKEKIGMLLSESMELVQASDDSRPN